MHLNAGDSMRLASRASLLVFHEKDQREAVEGWDGMTSLQRLHATRRALDEGIIDPRALALGRNKVLLQGITKLVTCFKTGDAYRFTHLDMGTSTAATTEGMTGSQAHADASAGIARVPITELLVDGKYLRTSTFLGTGEYVDVALAEACFCDAASGGTPYNRVLFDAVTTKSNTDTAVVNIDHQLTN